LGWSAVNPKWQEKRLGVSQKGGTMMVFVVLPVFVLIALVGSLPIWPHSKKWGLYPVGAVSVIILIVLFLFWTGRL
jgi:low affinity Fe/Cu permease